MTDPRTVWLITRAGAPTGSLRFALVRTPAEVDPGDLPSYRASMPAESNTGLGALRGWAAALSPDEAADPSYDAVPVGWKRRPDLLDDPTLAKAAIVGRAVEVAGCRVYMDDRGRAHPGSTPERPMTPLGPDVEIVDEAALVAHAEAQGRDVSLVERGTQRALLVDRAARRVKVKP